MFFFHRLFRSIRGRRRFHALPRPSATLTGAHRRRQKVTQPMAATPASASVPGSGTAVGVYVSDSVCLAASRFHPNVPAAVFTNPLVSNAVDAVSVAESVGPEYVPSQWTAGQAYDWAGSKLAIGPPTSVVLCQTDPHRSFT
jgi:hypothetical protein